MPSFLESAQQIARESGGLLSGYFARRVAVELKGDYDVVTEADRASEKLIVQRLTELYPSHAIVAEEGGGHESASSYRWYVDPLDGTTNFAHGFPIFNVTLAVEREGEMIAGVVYDPIRDEMFAAEKGAGATLNGKKISVSTVSHLESSLVATGFPSRKRHLNVNIHYYHQLAMATHGVRRAGSAAIDLAWVASGRLEAFWEFGLNPWDLAAGRLLVSEAGGSVTDMKGHPHAIRGPHLLADNGLIHDEIVDLFAAIQRGEYRYPIPVIQPE
jgi:myo-inositol-1(or 4)-monophosphatase